MIQVLRQIANYKGDGIAAKLFYEGKVIEAISLIMEYNRQQSSTPSVKISNADLRALENGAAYINDHFNCDISVDQLSILLVWDEQNSNSHLRKFMAFLSRNIFSRDG